MTGHDVHVLVIEIVLLFFYAIGQKGDDDSHKNWASF